MKLVMTTPLEAAHARIVCVEHGSGSLGHIAFWIEQLGDKPIADITEQDVDLAPVAFTECGKFKGGRGWLNPPISTEQSLEPSSSNRFFLTLFGLYKNSRRPPVGVNLQFALISSIFSKRRVMTLSDIGG